MQEAIVQANGLFNAFLISNRAHHAELRRNFVRGCCPAEEDYAEWCRIVDDMLPNPSSLKGA